MLSFIIRHFLLIWGKFDLHFFSLFLFVHNYLTNHDQQLILGGPSNYLPSKESSRIPNVTLVGTVCSWQSSWQNHALAGARGKS